MVFDDHVIETYQELDILSRSPPNDNRTQSDSWERKEEMRVHVAAGTFQGIDCLEDSRVHLKFPFCLL